METNTQKHPFAETKPRVILIEALPIFRMGLASMLRSLNEQTNIIGLTSTQQLQEVNRESENPTFFILGVEKFEIQELSKTLERIKSTFQDAQIIVYSHNQDYLNYVPDLLESGISAFLTNDFDANELGQCLNTVLQGKKYLNGEMLWGFLASQKRKNPFIPESTSLSRMETVVARHLTEGLGIKAIAEKMDRRSSTISTIKATVFRKLGVSNIIELNNVMKVSEKVS